MLKKLFYKLKLKLNLKLKLKLNLKLKLKKLLMMMMLMIMNKIKILKITKNSKDYKEKFTETLISLKKLKKSPIEL
jgi:hypothetical protein